MSEGNKQSEAIDIDALVRAMTDPIEEAALAFVKSVYPALKINRGIIVSIFEAGVNYQKANNTPINEILKERE